MGLLVIIGVERIFYSKAQCYCSISLRPTNNNSTETHKVEDIDQHTRNQGTWILSTTCSTCLSSVLTPTNEAPWLRVLGLGSLFKSFSDLLSFRILMKLFPARYTVNLFYAVCILYTVAYYIGVSQILCIFGSS